MWRHLLAATLPMSYQLTSSWIAQPGGFGWWDNRLAALHLPRDLGRPSSGLKELVQTMLAKQLVVALYQWFLTRGA